MARNYVKCIQFKIIFCYCCPLFVADSDCFCLCSVSHWSLAVFDGHFSKLKIALWVSNRAYSKFSASNVGAKKNNKNIRIREGLRTTKTEIPKVIKEISWDMCGSIKKKICVVFLCPNKSTVETTCHNVWHCRTNISFGKITVSSVCMWQPHTNSFNLTRTTRTWMFSFRTLIIIRFCQRLNCCLPSKFDFKLP